MLFQCRLRAAAVVTLLVILFLDSPPAFSAAPAARLCYWTFAEAGVGGDGLGRQKMVLHMPVGAAQVQPRFFCRVHPMRWSKRGTKYGQDSYHRLSPEFVDGKWQVEIATAGYARVTLWAAMDWEHCTVYAQTDFNLYGRNKAAGPCGSEARQPNGPALERELAAGGNHLEISLHSDGLLYWPQTGQRFYFDSVGEQHPSRIVVWEKNRKIMEAGAGEEKERFCFTAAHDRLLNNLGAAAFKELVAEITFENSCQILFYTLKIHRSRQAFMRLGPGLALTLAALAVSTLIVQWRRRSFPYL